MASGKIKELDAFHVGDSYNFGTGAVFNGYLANNYNGSMYAVLPKRVGADVSSVTATFSNINWIMRPSQSLTTNFSISDASFTSTGNQIIISFTTNITSSQFFIPVLINLTGLTVTFS